MCFDEERSSIEQVSEFLAEYRYGRRMLEMNRYNSEFFGAADAREVIGEEDEAFMKARMFEVRRFVTSLPSDERKLFLYYHYIKCESVERCGELMNISRRSAFRLKRRALEYAAIKYARYAPYERPPRD